MRCTHYVVPGVRIPHFPLIKQYQFYYLAIIISIFAFFYVSKTKKNAVTFFLLKNVVSLQVEKQIIKLLKDMKQAFNVLLGIAACFLVYAIVDSVMTPIKFDETRLARQNDVVAKLIDLRTAELEYRNQNGKFTDNYDSLFIFLREGKKKEVHKEGSLSDAQLEAGLTEAKAVKIIKSGDQKEIEKNGLQNFVRDTIFSDLIPALYGDKYTADNIEQMKYIPYSESNQTFIINLNNEYVTPKGNISFPLFEACAPFETFLSDLDHQELINLKDKEKQLEHYPGLRVGNAEEPNNFAGNWE